MGLMAGHVEALGDEYDAGCVLAPHSAPSRCPCAGAP